MPGGVKLRFRCGEVRGLGEGRACVGDEQRVWRLFVWRVVDARILAVWGNRGWGIIVRDLARTAAQRNVRRGCLSLLCLRLRV